MILGLREAVVMLIIILALPLILAGIKKIKEKHQ